MYDYVIIAGDFNVDFAKVSPNCAILEYFMLCSQALKRLYSPADS